MASVYHVIWASSESLTHSFAFMQGYSCLTGITIEKLYGSVAGAALYCAVSEAFSVEVSLGMFDCCWCLCHRSDSSPHLLHRWDNRCVCLCISSLRRETQSMAVIISAAAVNIC